MSHWLNLFHIYFGGSPNQNNKLKNLLVILHAWIGRFNQLKIDLVNDVHVIKIMDLFPSKNARKNDIKNW